MKERLTAHAWELFWMACTVMLALEHLLGRGR